MRRGAASATNTWKEEIVAPLGSAQLANKVEVLKNEFLEHLPEAIRAFTARVKTFQPLHFQPR
jgi:hypothetical protein